MPHDSFVLFLPFLPSSPKRGILIKDNRYCNTTPMGADKVVYQIVFPATIVFGVDVGHVHDARDGFLCSNQCLMDLGIIVSVHQRYDIVSRQTKGRRGVKGTENDKNDDKDFSFYGNDLFHKTFLDFDKYMFRNFKLVAIDFSLRPCLYTMLSPPVCVRPHRQVDSSTQAKACGYLKSLPKAA